jgi:hypothetical protein
LVRKAQNSMPTLINELSPQQRSWIFETFGHYGENDELSNGEASSDDLESQYINQNNNSKNNEVSTPVRRNSNESLNYCNDPSPTPYINMHHPFSHSSTDLPPLSASDQAPVDTHDNRSSIFRRTIGGSTSTNETNNTSPVREEEGLSCPVPASTRNSNDRTAKPHPGSIWSPLNDKIIIATPPSADHPIYGNNNTSSSHYEQSPNISNINLSNNFNMFPRPPFARSMNHNLDPSATGATPMALRGGLSTTMSMATSSKRQHHAINDDPNFHLHHPHYPHPPHLHHSHHNMYTMRPIQHQHHQHHFNHASTPLGHSKVPITADNGHHQPNSMHTPHHGDIININKPIVFPHSDDKLTWQQSFENLKIYKRIYGDCNVPQKYKLNVKLGGWVVGTHVA